MPNDRTKPNNTHIFHKAGELVSAVLRAAWVSRLSLIPCLVIFPALYPIGQVLAEDVNFYPTTPATELQIIPLPRTIIEHFVPIAGAKAVAPAGSSSGKSTNLSGNQITVHDGSVVPFVMGAINTEPSAEIVSGNIVRIFGSTVEDIVLTGVCGGYNLYGTAGGNEVHLTDTIVKIALDLNSGAVAGGFGLNAIGNRVFMTGGEVTKEIRGGFAISGITDDLPSTASNNTVVVNSGKVGEDVWGGKAVSDGPSASAVAKTSGNTVIITNGTIVGNSATTVGSVFGGGVESKNSNIHLISDNRVYISDSTVGNSVYGGWITSSTASGTATGNKVFLSNSRVSSVVTGGFVNGIADAVASENIVTISNGSIAGSNVNGGYAKSSNATATASNNHVTINNSTAIWNIKGGYAENGTDSTASHNIVVINNGTINEKVYGGRASGSHSATASNNILTFNGGTFAQNIYGGYVQGGSSRKAEYNTVNLIAGTFAGNIYGGDSSDIADRIDYFTGNTLNAKGYQGSVKYIDNFEYYNFKMPGDLTPDLKMIGITGGLAVNLADSHVTLQGKMEGGSVGLQPGEKIILIDKTTGGPLSKNASTVYQGIALKYKFRVDLDDLGDNGDQRLIAILENIETRTIDGRLPLLAFLNQEDWRLPCCVRGPFVKIGGNWNRTNTGGNIDVNGLTLRAGITKCYKSGRGTLLLAPFFETGAGDSGTFQVDDGNVIRGHGKLKYSGGGLYGRRCLPDGRYYDASVRIGGAEIDYDSKDLSDLTGERAAFDVSSLYAGSHVGMGHEWNVSHNMSFEAYGKYMYQHLAGGTAIYGGDPVHFRTLNSHRTRVGGRINHAVTRRLGYYHGAAWEREFYGTEYAYYYEYKLDGRSLKGDSGVGESGLTWKRSQNMPLDIDFGIQGYIGKREGGAVNLQVRWER